MNNPNDFSLKRLREMIDAADREILAAFHRRMDAVEHIGCCKRMNAIPLEDAEREKTLVSDKVGEDTPYREYSKKLLHGLIALSKSYQRRNLNLYLTGMCAEDKSNAAETLEKQTGRQAVDTNIIVKDRADSAVRDIFANEGEDGFIKREHEALTIAAEHGGLIVSAGAGILSQTENVQMMRASGYIVFLDVPLTRLLKLKYNDDPRVESSDDITRLYYERIVDYKSTADLILDPEAPDYMARILEFMKEKELG